MLRLMRSRGRDHSKSSQLFYCQTIYIRSGHCLAATPITRRAGVALRRNSPENISQQAGESFGSPDHAAIMLSEESGTGGFGNTPFAMKRIWNGPATTSIGIQRSMAWSIV